MQRCPAVISRRKVFFIRKVDCKFRPLVVHGTRVATTVVESDIGPLCT
jgi:hypothetical protein